MMGAYTHDPNGFCLYCDKPQDKCTCPDDFGAIADPQQDDGAKPASVRPLPNLDAIDRAFAGCAS